MFLSIFNGSTYFGLPEQHSRSLSGSSLKNGIYIFFFLYIYQLRRKASLRLNDRYPNYHHIVHILVRIPAIETVQNNSKPLLAKVVGDVGHDHDSC